LLFAVSLIVASFCISVVLPTFSVPYYIKEFDKYQLSEKIRVTEPDLRAVVKNLQRYMAGLDKDLDVVVKVAGYERKFFNEREISHMEDVRGLFLRGFAVLGASVAVLAVSIFYIVRKKIYYEAAKSVVVCSIAFFGAFGLLAAIIAVNFDVAFVIFHELFFDNDLWLLNPKTDLLINMLQQEFFINISKTIASYFLGSTAAALTVCAVFCSVIKRRAKKTKR